MIGGQIAAGLTGPQWQGADGDWSLRVGEITGALQEAEAERVQRRGVVPELTPLQRDLSAAGPRFGFFFSRKF